MRKRQVAVNVRIIDVSLLDSNILNTKFSFGLSNTSIRVAGVSINFGGKQFLK